MVSAAKPILTRSMKATKYKSMMKGTMRNVTLRITCVSISPDIPAPRIHHSSMMNLRCGGRPVQASLHPGPRSALLQQRRLGDIEQRAQAMAEATHRRGFRRQAKGEQRSSRHLVDMTERKRWQLRIRLVGIEQEQPVAPLRHRRKREIHDVEMRVVDQQQRRVRTAALDTRFLRAAIKQHAEAARVAVVPLFGRHLLARGRQPGDILDVELFIMRTDQE